MAQNPEPPVQMPHHHQTTLGKLPPGLFDISPNDGQYTRFDHPLDQWNASDAEILAENVATMYGQEIIRDIFVKAAEALRRNDPRMWSSIPDITEAEQTALENEKKARFRDQPWPLQTTYFMLFLGAIVQGWTQTGTNAANLGWPQDLLYRSDGNTTNVNAPAYENLCGPDENHTWIFAAVNAAPYLAASIGCWISDPLNELFFGRRPAIAVSAILVFASSIGSAYAYTWQTLLVWRAILGIGMGCKAAVIPVFMAEIAPAHLRGSLVMNWQVFDTVGILLGFAANVVVPQTGLSSVHSIWRWQVASLCIPAFALLCGNVFISWDSPRFLMKHEEAYRTTFEQRSREWKQRQVKIQAIRKGRVDKGILSLPQTLWDELTHGLKSLFKPNASFPYRSPTFESLLLLRGHPILAAKELILVRCQHEVEARSNISRSRTARRGQTANPREDGTTPLPDNHRTDAPQEDHDHGNVEMHGRATVGWFKRVRHLWSKKYIRYEARAAAYVMISQQLCGINVLIFFSSTLFCDVGKSEEKANSFVPLMLSLGIGLTNFIFALPAYKWIETHGRRWLVVFTLPFLALTMAGAAVGFSKQDRTTVAIFAYLFTAIYSPGLGPVPFTYSSEIFPLEQRMVGMSFAVSVNFFFAGLFTLLIPRLATTSLGNPGLLGVFAACNIVALNLVWRYVPEVVGGPIENDRHNRKPMTLEQLIHIFKIPLDIYRDYQWEVYMPYVKECWINFFSGKASPDKPPDYYPWGRERMTRLL